MARPGRRHLDVLRSLGEKGREREEPQWEQPQQKKRERQPQRASTIPAARSSSQQPPPLPGGCGAAGAAATAPLVAAGAAVALQLPPQDGSGTVEASMAGATLDSARGRAAQPEDQASPEERRQYQARCNSDIERRQEEAIRKVQDRANLQRVKVEREQLKRQWRAYKAQTLVLSQCQNEALREYLETKSKPRALPKLPVLPAARRGGAGAEEADGAASPPSAAEQDGVCPPAAAEAARRPPSGGGRADDPLAEAVVAALKVEAIEHSSSPSRAAKERQVQSINRFLCQKGNSRLQGCSDLAEWKRRNGCAADRRVFVCVGGYPDFRDALLARGWMQNPDKASAHFDLKWGMQKDIDHEHILPGQIANHFHKTRELTTKVGLTLNLRNSYHWGADMDSFYPRAYDLYDQNDRSDFVLNFKLTKAESILHAFLEHVDAAAAMTFADEVVSTCIDICIGTITDPDEVLDCPEMAEALNTVSAERWSLLEQVSLDDVSARLDDGPDAKDLADMIQKKLPTTDAQRRSEAESRKLREQEKEKELNKKPKKKKKKSEAQADEPVQLCAPVASYETPRGKHLVRQARTVLEEMRARDRQHSLNGSKNAWIIKPSGKSRGRGIKVVRDLKEIFRMTETDGFQWICQKYIEQPHLVHGFKFDIRQWILVTDWNPLTVYIWRHPYLRFAGQKYDGLASKDPFVHLTNNSIIKYMDGFDRKDSDSGVPSSANGFMWFRQQYEEYIHATCCKCKKHRTPWLVSPPYTCESFGVKWEDVAFTNEDEDEEEVYDETRGDSAAAVDEAGVAPGGESADNSSEADEGGLEPGDEAAQAASQVTDGHATPPTAPAPAPPECAEALDGADGHPVPGATWVASADVDEDDEEACCENLWETSIAPQIEKSIMWSLLNVSDSIPHRKNTCELFGYDFMISTGKEKPEVWLIEVNSSPACDYSTPVTCPLVKKMMEDTAKVMVDLKDDPAADTGEWELMKHDHSKTVSMRTCACSNLEVCGKRMKPPKGYKKMCKKMRAEAKAADAAAEGASDGDDAEA